MNVRRHAVRRLGAAAALVVFAAGLAACVPPPNADISCAWPIRADQDTLNVAYPDTGATYYVTKYTLFSGQSLTLEGTYPFGRYLSVITYDIRGNVVDDLSDVDIAPNAGSDNPFVDPAASTDPTERRWTITIDPDTATAAATNTLAAATIGAVIVRVYVPDDAGDPMGGVPLPSLSVHNTGGAVTPIAPCSTQGADPAITDLINAFGPTTDIPPSDPPSFNRPLSVAGLYANPDNIYLASIVAHRADRVLVVRGRAPTAPDTEAGLSPATPSQLRYWSLCTNEYRKPYPVTDCAYDHQAPLDGSGDYTFVISTAGDRPANATEANGVRWLDWGNTSTDLLMTLRHMRPDPAFGESAFNVAPGQQAADVMGDYTPVITVCDTGGFEASGIACDS